MKFKIILLFFCCFFALTSCINEDIKSIQFISFDEVVYDFELKVGENIDEPILLTKEGYSFLGWYKDKELTDLYYFNDVVIEDRIFYAKWLKATEEKYFDFEEIDGKLTLVNFKYLENNDKTIVIPQTVNGKIVKVISEGVYHKEDEIIRSYIIPEGIEEIGQDCFYESKIDELYLPRNIKIFQGIPFGFSIINKVYMNSQDAVFENGKDEKKAFSFSRINEFYYSGGIKVFDFSKYIYFYITTLIMHDDVEEISANAFIRPALTSINNIIFSKNLKIINEKAFFGMKRLTSLNLPEGVEIIKKNAFASCPLRYVLIPSGVKVLEEGIFTSPLQAAYISGNIEIFEPKVFPKGTVLFIDLAEAKDTWDEDWNNDYVIYWLRSIDGGNYYE
ncbi:MAG: leucine-rich repeat protein [Bacilli bacterium]